MVLSSAQVWTLQKVGALISETRSFQSLTLFIYDNHSYLWQCRASCLCIYFRDINSPVFCGDKFCYFTISGDRLWLISFVMMSWPYLSIYLAECDEEAGDLVNSLEERRMLSETFREYNWVFWDVLTNNSDPPWHERHQRSYQISLQTSRFTLRDCQH